MLLFVLVKGQRVDRDTELAPLFFVFCFFVYSELVVCGSPAAA